MPCRQPVHRPLPAPERLVAAFATERLLAQPFVLVAVDGGTGSGKSTLTAHTPRQRAHLVVDASADAAAADAGLVTERWSPPPAAGYRMRQS